MRWAAPGKVVLLGEYAVLDGAPAVVAAVDSGVQVAWEPGDSVRILAPDDRFVRPALQAVDAPSGTWTFSPWRPVPTATKAGLGSSAAATVVAVRAGLEARGGRPRPEEVLAIARDVHHRVQGSGSGVDVAASAIGGVIRFEEGLVQPVRSPTPVVVWSGRSAATGPRVERYLAWTDGRSRFVAESRDLVDRFQADPLAALERACRILEGMTERAGIDWWTDALRAIVDLARRCGGAAKPSGAGGGDSAVALFPTVAAEQLFRERCAQAGWAVLPLSIAGPAHRLQG